MIAAIVESPHLNGHLEPLLSGLPSDAQAPLSDPLTQRVSRRLACLLDVAQIINSSLELDAVLDHILVQARQILQAESGSIMLVDDSGTRLCVHAAQGPRAHEIRGRCRKLGEGVAGWVAVSGEPLLLQGQTRDPRFKRVHARSDVRESLCAPLKAEQDVIGVISLSNAGADHHFSHEDLELLVALTNQAALAIRNARSYEEMVRQRRTVERLLREVTRAQEEERKRIALQIHDGPAQTLFAALRDLEAVQAHQGSLPSLCSPAMDQLAQSIRCAINETRALMLDMRPPCLDDVGLLGALRRYGQQFSERTGIRVLVEQCGLRHRPPTATESVLYRIAQEALTNVWKHAQATAVTVLLEVDAETCSLQVADNGVGFDLDRARREQDEHIGLVSLRDRTDLIGGRLSLHTEPGIGTTVRVTIPIAE